MSDPLARHAAYDDGSTLRERLGIVQARLAGAQA